MSTTTVRIFIETGNSDFTDDLPGAISATLSSIPAKVQEGDTYGILFDRNGNRVGHFTVDIDP